MDITSMFSLLKNSMFFYGLKKETVQDNCIGLRI